MRLAVSPRLSTLAMRDPALDIALPPCSDRQQRRSHDLLSPSRYAAAPGLSCNADRAQLALGGVDHRLQVSEVGRVVIELGGDDDVEADAEAGGPDGGAT